MADIEITLVEQLAEHFTKSFENLTEELKEVVSKNYFSQYHWNEISIFQRISKAQEVDYGKTLESVAIHECIFKFNDINKFIEDNYSEAVKKDKEGVALILRQLKDEVNLDEFMKLLTNVENKVSSNKDLSKAVKGINDRERNSLYRIIAALTDTLLNVNSDNTDKQYLKNQTNLIVHLDNQYDGYEGVSKSNLEKVFSVAKKLLHPT